jgi:hypothetical protein
MAQAGKAQRQVVGLINAPPMDVKAVVARETGGTPLETPLTPEAREAEAQKSVAQAVTSSRVTGETLLTASESKDFAQAYNNWLRGEQLAGSPIAGLDIQKVVRQGLVDTILGQRPGGANSFERFMSM